jgi:hypothetical protein
VARRDQDRRHHARLTQPSQRQSPWAARPRGFFVRAALLQRLLGKLNTAPSRTPALGQRWVMVLRLV